MVRPLVFGRPVSDQIPHLRTGVLEVLLHSKHCVLVAEFAPLHPLEAVQGFLYGHAPVFTSESWPAICLANCASSCRDLVGCMYVRHQRADVSDKAYMTLREATCG